VRLLTRTVGTTTVTRDAAGRTTKAVKVSGRLVRKLRAAKGAAFVVVATVKETPGERVFVLTARAVLHGRWAWARRWRRATRALPISRRTR
jgi:hypothetical protein